MKSQKSPKTIKVPFHLTEIILKVRHIQWKGYENKFLGSYAWTSHEFKVEIELIP